MCPYVERDESGAIISRRGTVDAIFYEARNYLSTAKLESRLDEYPAVHAEAARLGLSFDDAVADICARWPEWIDDEAEIEPTPDPAPSGVFDSGPALEEIREAYEDSHTDNEGAGDVGSVVDSGADHSGDGGELVEALEDDPAGDPADYSAEPVGDDSALGEPGAYSGVMVTGDPLKAAQMELTWAVGDKEDELISVYPADENLARLNELRGIALAIKEGVHPAFDEETAAELQALETFASWLSAVRTNADRLRNTIRQAADMDALGLIDIHAGWPE